MTERKKQLVIVRGGGDLATGTIHKLHRCGYPVLVLESAFPSAIRRQVAFSEAVYDGIAKVEGVTCVRADRYEEALKVQEEGNVPMMVDETCEILRQVRPWALVDGILAKRNAGGTHRGMADKTVALGPGFTAGEDVDLVIETKRGHRLGRIIEEGTAIPNTGVPGIIGGYSKERVIHAPAQGTFYGKVKIGDMVDQGQPIGIIVTDEGEVPVKASLAGLLRGLIRDGYPVTMGFKTADIDPRKEEYANCFTISDKARCIAGSVVEALQMLEVRQGR